ncbi:TonB-dependent receptor-like protein [Marinoscillum furvescens DSM 4134]|uniref:TonB-dependent receptor-like protein n=2 Tax=Marinoscillum furvescens TaxID=1026 RepID=A0A3D9KXA4_MARFU|nr:TonB-dependent receptor-like protein [Marinoscillum furvescens DSM 4134]
MGMVLLLSTTWLSAQKITGRVVDEVSLEGLPGATVQVIDGEAGAVTDESGFFDLEVNEPGRYTLQVSYVGYQMRQVTEVWVRSGKSTWQDISLQRTYLNAVMVTDSRNYETPGSIQITEEQINRFAATYYDPARLVTSSPDVAVANDQNNQVSIRGLSPDYNVWRLEGVEVVNPNHLANAGTFLDRPSATGGGVNMLSAQMLSQSSLQYGAFGVGYGNSLAGVFDMTLKNGASDQRKYTAQASLIGLDFATEGPFKEGGRATYAANYRYSFTGLLTSFGVDFGGESIGFQDLAMSISLPVGKRTNLKIFGVGGLSFNNFDHRTFEESEEQKDRSDIYYENKTGIVGASLNTTLAHSSLNTSLAVSGYSTERDQFFYNENDEQEGALLYANEQRIISLNSEYQRYLGGAVWKLGVQANSYLWNPNITDEALEVLEVSQYLVRPYTELEAPLAKRTRLTAGVSFTGSNEGQTVDYRVFVKQLLGDRQSMYVGGGQYSQLLNPNNSIANNPFGFQLWKNNYDLQRSYRLMLGHSWTGSLVQIQSELFAYQVPDINENSALYSYGLSVHADRKIASGLYYRVGGSVFESGFTESEEELHTDTGFNLSASAGKEWNTSKKGKNKRFSVDVRGMMQGGQHYPEIGSSSMVNYYQVGTYVRADVRLVWTRFHENRTSSIALDLQNAAGIKNEAYRYYDSFTGQEETKYQLGLIPILAYRVEW